MMPAPITDVRKHLLERMEIDESGCWIWQLARTNGYGRLLKGYAHRIAHEVFVGPLRVVVDGVTYDCTRPTEHQAGVHRLIRHYRRTDVPVVVGVAS